MPESPLEGRPCIVCGEAIQVKLAPWSARCPACGTWRSSLEPEIESVALQGTIDVDARHTGLKELRDRNNQQILDRISRLLPLSGARLLDVGSAHGWFLEAAENAGADAVGIEPEAAMAAHARAAGRTIREGYFPAVLADGEQADVITFNDVLEHIPDAEGTLAACAKTLREGGVLSVNIPSATGLGYRVASLLARIGIRGPYLRFWQHGLPSPHAHYFPPQALARLIERQGLQVVATVPLSAVERRGLWARLHTVGRVTPISILTFAALWCAAPILNRPRNSDIVLLVAQKAATAA